MLPACYSHGNPCYPMFPLHSTQHHTTASHPPTRRHKRKHNRAVVALAVAMAAVVVAVLLVLAVMTAVFSRGRGECETLVFAYMMIKVRARVGAELDAIRFLILCLVVVHRTTTSSMFSKISRYCVSVLGPAL